MCNCAYGMQEKLKNNFGYKDVTFPIEPLSGRIYLNIDVTDKNGRKSNLPLLFSRCPFCGKKYDEGSDNE